jgi:erythromycin esterase-like protein
MYSNDISSWNLRDHHMMETLIELNRHLTQKHQPPKIVIWEHNSHLGDARATAMGERGEWNVGQLVREHFAGEAALVGFTTYHGTVTASSDWGGKAERKRVRPALDGSIESLFHETEIERFLLPVREAGRLKNALRAPRLERAIGVIYRPETERQSHYFHARLADQFDAVIHIDETRAVEPLERTSLWDTGELPETYPSGL